MPRISSLAGAVLCLSLICAAPAMAQTPDMPQNSWQPETHAPIPLSPQAQPVLQPQPATQTLPYQPANGSQALPNKPWPPGPKLQDNAPPKPAAVSKHTKHKATKRRSTHHKSSHKKSVKKHSSHVTGKAHIRAAQVYLDQLGYAPGPTDGIMGRKTKMAIKEFQRDHNLRVTGMLTDATFAALEREAGSHNPVMHTPQQPPDFVATHPDFYGYYGKEGVSPTSLASPQGIPSRFGNLQIDQQLNGQASNYTISMNGQQVYHADNQPSYIDVSRTFQVDDNTDAIVLTSYNNGNITCSYKHQLLIIKSSGSNVRDIADCTHDFEAYTENGMLMISFPGSHVDGLSKGALWRYDNGTFEKL